MAVRSSDWLDLMRREYLQKFTPGGGSAIKFIIGEDAELADIRRKLVEFSVDRGLHNVAIDAATTKIHMIQDMFFAVSRSIDWENLAQIWVEDAFFRNKYVWPRSGESVPLHEIAAANDMDEHLLRRQVYQWITREVLRKNELAQDFRSAMGNLCLRRMEFDDDRATAPVVEWLRGDLRTIGPVRAVPLNAKITRHNGRSMLQSLCHWLRLCGGPGITVTLDLTQLGRIGAAAGPGIRYSTPAVMDAYEVLRQLIDDAERFEGWFLAVLVNPSFRDDDTKRGVQAYFALKHRLWPDVHARAHENPLTPMLQITGAGDVATTLGELLETPFSEERVAIEALRAGVPNGSAIRELGSSEDALCSRFVDKLQRNRAALTGEEAIEGELVEGGFGSGKSHMLGFLAQKALKENYIVSLLPVSKETPLFDPQRMFTAAIRNAVVPAVNSDAMTEIMLRLDPASRAFVELETWASDESSGLSPIFAALLYLLPRQTLLAEDRARIARFFAGANLPVPKVREWLKNAGASKLFAFGATKAADLAIQRLRFAPRLFVAAGFGGWCILIDEIELIGRYSVLQRGRSYGELCRWLNLDASISVPGVVAVMTISSDFQEQMFDIRLDEEKIPAYLDGKSLEIHARLSKVGIKQIKRATKLSAPNEDQLHRSLDRVRSLYAESYGWPAALGDIGERRQSRSMREFIKAWITVWDIDRIYGQTAAIDTEELPSDYTENKDLEQPPPLEAVDAEVA